VSGEAGSGVAPISKLTLDRRLLTLMVVGAGFGESVLVALPRSEGWIVIDGAAPNGAPPAIELLERYWSGAGAIELLLLTHPHADHYAGFLKILDHEKLGPAVKRIGCVSHYLGVAYGSTLGREVEAAFEAIDVHDAEALRELGGARNVLERIGDEWLKQPSRRWVAVRGAALAFGEDLHLHVLGPERKHVDSFFTAPDLARRIVHQANDLSVVLDLYFGATRLVLGGDLPKERNRTSVPSGWSHLCSVMPGLNEHTGYKVSHHASREAIHAGVVASCGDVRTWVTTPWNKGETLPRFEDGEGVSELHAHESEVLLTALPVGIRAQVPMLERLPRADLQPAVLTMQRKLGRLGPAVASGPAVRSPPSECVWAIQFDDQGQAVARYRGEVATTVV